MIGTFKTSFSIKNTYRANTVLFSLKQIPIVKKLLPDSLYSVRDIKTVANIIAAIYEVISAFAMKFLYLALMIFLMTQLFEKLAPAAVSLNIWLFLTIAGAILNTGVFKPDKSRYYAVNLMRMDAKEYTLSNYCYMLLKVVVGFMPFSLILGALVGIPLWFCAVIPFCVAGAKAFFAFCMFLAYEKGGRAYNENAPAPVIWFAVTALICAAYGLPVMGFVLPMYVYMAAFALFIPAGIFGILKLFSFERYREMNQSLVSLMLNQMDVEKTIEGKSSEKVITNDASVTSRRKGFEYLNDLFIKRHRGILWGSTIKITLVCLGLIAAMAGVLYCFPDFKSDVNGALLNCLPFLTFIMYGINRGTGFTKALFMNCDRSLLTYSFYKQPKSILRLFTIRMRGIIKINLLPALVIGAGLPFLLWLSGGTKDPLNYAVLFVSIVCMSIFFSIHYLVAYYLLQPYSAGTELKSGTYKIVMYSTYAVCLVLLNLEIPNMTFGIAAIAFCVIYSVAACVIVYKMAPQTFRLRF